MTEQNYWKTRYKRRRVLQGMGGLSLGSAFLIACGSDDDATATPGSGGGGGGGTATATATPTPGEVTEGNRGGDLVMANNSDVQRLDFQQTISTPTQKIAGMVFNRLMEFDPQSPPNTWVIRPDLADSWELGETQWVFKLRQGVKWQNLDPVNGREFTSEDVKFTYERAMSSGPEWVWRYKLEAVDNIQTPDPYTVVFNLKAPAAAMLLDLAHGPGMGIIPREIVDADGDLDKRWVGTGPFILDQFEPGNFQHLVRNPDYFRENRPYLDSVRVNVIPDATTRLSNFLAKRVAMHEAGAEDVSQIESSLGVSVLKFPSLTSTYLVPNVGPTGTAEMQDLRVRQAFDYAVDREQLLMLAWGGEGTVAGPAIHPGMGEFSPSDDFIAQTYAQDLQKARQLLEAAGYPDLKIPLHYSNVDTRAQDMLPVVKQQVAEAGIDVELLPEERAVYLQRQPDANFTLQAIGSGTGPDPDAILFPYYHTNGGKNWGRVSDPELDGRIDAERSELDAETRAGMIRGIAEDWKDYLYRMHLLLPNGYLAWQENVQNSFLAKGADWRALEEVWLA